MNQRIKFDQDEDRAYLQMSVQEVADMLSMAAEVRERGEHSKARSYERLARAHLLSLAAELGEG